MSGHSHWHGIRHKKALTDAKKASVFTKFGKLITIATREGGSDPSTNVRLRLVMDQARSANMPKDNIERAIKRGTGELKDGALIENVEYEALGPGGVAMIIQGTTDNKNRTVSEVKTILKKNGGQVASTKYLFEEVGALNISLEKIPDRDAFELEMIEAGVHTIEENNEELTLYTQPQDLKKVESVIGDALVSSTLEYKPFQTRELDEESQKSYQNLIELLEEQEDVQVIFDNLTQPDSLNS